MIAISIATIAHFTLLESLHLAGGNIAVLVPLENLPVHAAHAILGLLNFIGAEWDEGIKISSLLGVVSLLKFGLYPLVLLFPALHVNIFTK